MKIFITIILIYLPQIIFGKIISNVTIIHPDKIINYEPILQYGLFTQNLQIYCNVEKPKYFGNYFQSLILQLTIDNNDFVHYEGDTPDIVETHYENQRSIFTFNIFNTNKKRMLKLNPFNQTCIGIVTAHPYSIELKLIKFDILKVALLTIGLLVFLSSKRLSETPLFYYICGILLGIFASFLILVYLVSKLFPKRPMMYGVLVGGWTLGLYFAQLLWDNIQLILMNYQMYALYYILITGFISFVVCYRLGPPQNQRSKDCIKWGLQLSAIVMIYTSSYFYEAAIGINLITITYYYVPINWIPNLKKFWRQQFPGKRKLLTQDEFYEEGIRETRKALESLKQFCNTPESKPWKTMMKLNDPQRFASFIEGSPHILDEERSYYETSQMEVSEDDISEDEISDDDNDNYIENDNNDNLNNYKKKKNNFNAPSSSSSSSNRINKIKSDDGNRSLTIIGNRKLNNNIRKEYANNSDRHINYRRINNYEFSEDDD